MTDPQSDTPLELAWLWSLARNAAMVPIWVARLIYQHRHPGPPALGTLGVDVVLAALYLLWVNRPLIRELGSAFMDRQHMSGCLAVFMYLAVFFLGRDLWLFWKDMPL